MKLLKQYDPFDALTEPINPLATSAKRGSIGDRFLNAGAPEPMSSPADRHDHLVKMPNIVRARRLSSQAAGILRSEFLRPAADRFVGNDNATLQQHLFHQTQAQRKSEVEPDRMGDHSGWKTMALVA